MSVWVIVRLTFREAARKKVLLAALLLGLVFLVVYALGYHQIQVEIKRSSGNINRAAREFSNFIIMAGLYVVNFLTLVMTVLTSVDTLAGEISSGTVHVLISKPLRRWEVAIGKLLGFAGMFTLYLLLMAGGVLGIAYFISGTTVPNMTKGLALLWLNCLLVLTVSLAGGAKLSTLANGVMVFGLYGIAFVGGWVEQIGSLINKQAAIDVGIAASLLFPSEALWKRAAFEMQSPMFRALGASPFAPLSTPSSAMVVYAILYMTAVLFFAIRAFNRRDL